MRLIALAAGLAFAAATPALALTVQAAPPRPDVVQHLKPEEGRSGGPRLQDGFVGAGRPMMSGSGFTGAPQTMPGTTSFGFGNVRATVTQQPYDARWSDRRETPAPLSLSPYIPRR